MCALFVVLRPAALQTRSQDTAPGGARSAVDTGARGTTAPVQGRGACEMAGGARVVTRGRGLAAVVLLGALMAGTLQVCSRPTGPSLWTVSVGQGPTALAVDGRRERVFVANTGDAT